MIHRYSEKIDGVRFAGSPRLRFGGEVVAELELPADETVIRDVLRAPPALDLDAV